MEETNEFWQAGWRTPVPETGRRGITAADSPAESGAILTEPSGLSLSNAGQQLLIGRPGFSFGCFG